MALTHNRTADYWISPSALSIQLNAMSHNDYIQASCTTGARILCYIKDIITYDAGHNYRSWTLQASPTSFGDYTAKYVYVAIPRDMTQTTARVVFPSEQIDIYGKAERTLDGTTVQEQVGSTDYYYIFLQGIITSSGANHNIPRDWQSRFDTGTLSSDEAINANNDSEWYQYSSFDQTVTFLKDITMRLADGTYHQFRELFARTLSIVSGGKIQFGTTDGSPYVDGIAQSTGDSTESAVKIVTPRYMDNRALSRDKDDSNGTHKLTLGNLQVGTPDQFGNTTMYGTLNIGTYSKGNTGAQIDWYGNAEFESIVARSFLEVPELRYNRTTITVGNKWQTVGAGIIERVWAGTGDNALTGIAKLKLEATEPGAIAVDDKCQGIFHFVEGNDTQTSDPKNGNYHFAGFTTVYFIVKEIYTADTLPADIKSTLPEDETIGDNQYFRYELRAKTCADLAQGERNRWTDTHHPQPSMHFACYANATNSARQSCRLTTTTYQLHLAGMTDWTYTQEQIRLIIGWLDGFTLRKQVWNPTTHQLEQQDKALAGEGIAVGNMYMWGTIDQFDRAPSVIMQQLYYRSTNSKDTILESIAISPDRQSYDKGTWQTTPITPTPTTRYVYQQWLYTYSDGTYAVSNVQLYAIDNTLLTVTPNRTLVSVAISDWYDPDNPDDVTFDLTAQIKSGTEPLAITTATAQYSSDGATLSYTTQLSADQKTVTYHITLAGYVGVPIDGATPEDTYLTLALTTALGTGTATVTISQNIAGEAGADGQDGQTGNGINTISFARMYSTTMTQPATDAAGWVTEGTEGYPTEQGLSTTQPYLWQRKQTTYTQTTDVTTEVTLLAQHYSDEQHVYAGIWKSGKPYFYANGVRHVVRDLDAAGSTTYTYYRMKQRTTDPMGYQGFIHPYADTSHWEQANYLKFTATDLLLAEEVITDKLTVTKLATSGSDSHVTIQDGMMEIFGAYAFPNIRIGIDTNGCAILIFYDKDGNPVYNLGPGGLSQIGTSEATFATCKLKPISTTGTAEDIYNQISNIKSTDSNVNTYYIFTPKKTTTGSTTVYFYGIYSDNGSNTPPTETGKYYNSNTLGVSGERKYLPAVANNYIPDGWYAKPNSGIHYITNPEITQEGNTAQQTYRADLFYFKDGLKHHTGYIQWTTQDNTVTNVTTNLPNS